MRFDYRHKQAQATSRKLPSVSARKRATKLALALGVQPTLARQTAHARPRHAERAREQGSEGEAARARAIWATLARQGSARLCGRLLMLERGMHRTLASKATRNLCAYSHTHTYMYVCMYVCVSVSVCVSIFFNIN